MLDRLRPIEISRQERVVQDHGWTLEGAIWVSYRLSGAAIESGVVGVPAAKGIHLQGSFQLLDSRHSAEIGKLTVKDASAWGLGPFFRRGGGVEKGDFLLMVFNLHDRTATVSVGDEGLIERFQDGS